MILEMDAGVAEAVAPRAGQRNAAHQHVSIAAKKLIAPRLGRFHRVHPDVVLDIVIDDG